jgi:hypothetical protein
MRLTLAVLAVAGALALGGCGAFDGGVTLALTDSPVLAADVTRAVITIGAIEYTRGENTQNADSGWETLIAYDPPQAFDLLALQGGVVAELAAVTIPAGHVGQIRFILDAPEALTGQAPPSTPGCYLELADLTQVPLFVPSGSAAGFRAVGAFDVPINGDVEITADFDVRKSLVRRGTLDSYILKPTIRLVVNAEAGDIIASLGDTDTYETLVVYAYLTGTYADAEETVPASEEDPPQFAGAVSSAVESRTTAGAYRLSFLAGGTYDLVVAAYAADGAYVDVVATLEDVVVASGENTNVTIDLVP